MKLTSLTIAMLVTFMWISIGCSKPPPAPKFHIVKAKTHNIKKCGRIRYNIKDGMMVLSLKDGKCLFKNTKECCIDRSNLKIAYNANVKQMEIANESN